MSRRLTLGLGPAAALACVVWLLWSVPQLIPPGAGAAGVLAALAVALAAFACATLVSAAVRHVAAGRDSFRSDVLPIVAGTASMALIVTVWAHAQRLGAPPSLAGIPPWALVVLVTALGGGFAWAAHDMDASRNRIAAERIVVVQETQMLDAATRSQQLIMAEVRASIVSAAEAHLAPALDRVESHLALLRSAAARQVPFPSPLDLRGVADGSLRPLVGALSDQDAVPSPRLSWWGFVVTTVRAQPIVIAPLVVVYLLSAPLAYLPVHGAAVTLLLCAQGVALVILIAGGTNLVMRRFPSRHASIYLLGVIALVLPGVAYVAIWLDEPPGAIVGTALISLGITALASVTFSGIALWRDRQGEFLDAYRRELEERASESASQAHLTALVARDVARDLHGPVQARLAACAFALDVAAAKDDLEAYAAALEEARDVLSKPLLADRERVRGQSLQDAVGATVGLWAGLIEVRTAIEESAGELTGVLADDAGRIVEEALSNAVRHGAATRAVVVVWLEGESVMISVEDNGGQVDIGPPGLGSVMMDDVTGGSWSLIAGAEDGMTLRARLSPIQMRPHSAG